MGDANGDANGEEKEVVEQTMEATRKMRKLEVNCMPLIRGWRNRAGLSSRNHAGTRHLFHWEKLKRLLHSGKRAPGAIAREVLREKVLELWAPRFCGACQLGKQDSF
jgi:hypothetical protein